MELVYVSVLEAEFCEFESRPGHHLTRSGTMKIKDTLDKAYGSIPKETTLNFDLLDLKIKLPFGMRWLVPKKKKDTKTK